MSYPIPMQVHVIWHPESDTLCRPLAEEIYTSLNRDAYEPLVPGVGIPVFFRCAGAVTIDPTSAPAAIELAGDTTCDLRLALLTPELVMDPVWQAYLDACSAEVNRKRDRAAMIRFGLTPGMLDGNDLGVRLDTAGMRRGELLLRHALLQACRLAAGRPRDDAAVRGAAPLKLFLSHTKRDKQGIAIARALKSNFEGFAADRFFDEISIQPGDDLAGELEANIADAALVAIRTDRYVSSPWCRWELALAKRHRRPIVIVDALSVAEPRSSSLLANLPSARIDPSGLAETELERVSNFVGLEVLRFLHASLQLNLLKGRGLVAEDAILLSRPPEARDLGEVFRATGVSPGNSGRKVFVYPDPVLGAEEAEEFAAYGATLVTPTGIWAKRLDRLRLGLSVGSGDDAEERALGLSPLHLEDATRVIARQALTAGASLVYGGALLTSRPEDRNFTAALFGMIGAYNKRGNIDFPPLVNHVPWPWWEDVDMAWLAERRRMLTVKRCALPADAQAFGGEPGPGRLARLVTTAEGRFALGRSLTTMREAITAETDARVVLGGKPHGFMGLLPGVLEEVLLAIRKRRPVYVVGGFGGAAKLVAQALAGRRPDGLTLEYQVRASPGYAETLGIYERERTRHPDVALPRIDYDEVVRELETCGVSGLVTLNGLSENENRELMVTGSIDSALHLIMKGLATVWPERQSRNSPAGG